MRRFHAMARIVVVVGACTAVAVVTAPGSHGASTGGSGAGGTSGRSSEGARLPAATPKSDTTTSTPNSASAPLGTTSTEPPAGPPYQFQEQTFTFVDSSRNTPPRGSVPASSGRVIATVVRRPIGEMGPLPLVVFGHGWNSNPGVYAPVLDTWAQAGFLVAAVTFPDSANVYPGTPVADYSDQARDLSFVIGQMLTGVAGPADPNRVAVAGHSDGGSDVCLLAFDPYFADHRIRGYLAMSGDTQVGLAGPFDATTPGAFEEIVGTQDEYGEYPKAMSTFQAAGMPKVLLTVDGGDHLGMYIASTPQSDALRQETVRFLTAALGPATPSSAQLAQDSQPTGDPSILVNS
jgi:poly(3-hydroxybutyrate) depolymerase